MSQELKMQAQLKKIIANTETVANEELSDEQLDTVAGGAICGIFASKVFDRICIFSSRIHSAK